MLVLAALPHALQKRLMRPSLPYEFVAATTWSEAIRLIEHEPVEIAVVDPALDGNPRDYEVEHIRVRFPSLPIILFSELSPRMAPVLLKLGTANIRHMIVAYHEDHAENIREVLAEESSRAVTHTLLLDLRPIIADWPNRLRWAVERAVREPAGISSVKTFAHRARLDRRTCLRWFDRAGLPSPSITLKVLRVLYAHRLLQDPGYTIEHIATKLGCGTRAFQQNFKEVFGRPPGEVRLSVTPQEALAIVRERFLATRPDGPDVVAVGT